MTSNNVTKRSIKIAAPILAILFTLSMVSLPAAAVDCSQNGAHCYSVVSKVVDNRGGTGTINLNPSNSVDSSSAIVNSLWIAFPKIGTTDSEWLEVGWQKGTSMQPCYASTAKYHTYDAIGIPTSHAGTCEGSTSGSTATLGIYDTNLDDYWGLKINGSQKDTVYKDEDSTYMSVGGESTDEDNVLDGGGVSSLVIVTLAGTGSSWTSTGLAYNTDADYVYNWNTQYTDFGYDGS